MRTITFPNGQVITMDTVTGYIVEGSAVKFTTSGGESQVYTAQSPQSAAAMPAQIAVSVTAGDNKNTNIYETPSISNVAPASFDISSGGGANLTITGFGFSNATIGKLCFEDIYGGPDSNGYYFTCTYVSPTELTAVYGGAGDGTLSTQMLVYYQDSNGVQSNILPAYNPTGTTIVMIPTS